MLSAGQRVVASVSVKIQCCRGLYSEVSIKVMLCLTMAASTDNLHEVTFHGYFQEPGPIVSQISLLFLYGNLHIS